MKKSWSETRYLFEESQMFNKLIRTLLFGLALWMCFWLGLGHNPSMAATLTSVTSGLEKSVQPPDEIFNLEAGVDRFLTSIPSGYFTIANISGLKDRLKNPQTILVDVREPSEYRAGHIPDAINIPLHTLTHNLDKIPSDRPVVLYCSTGYRSAMGVMTLHLLGYENVKGFPSSFAGWKMAGEAIAQ
jgi:rhodanese-related sulfurtransferase